MNPKLLGLLGCWRPGHRALGPRGHRLWPCALHSGRLGAGGGTTGHTCVWPWGRRGPRLWPGGRSVTHPRASAFLSTRDPILCRLACPGATGPQRGGRAAQTAGLRAPSLCPAPRSLFPLCF